jgi:hypothetical protein
MMADSLDTQNNELPGYSSEEIVRLLLVEADEILYLEAATEVFRRHARG